MEGVNVWLPDPNRPETAFLRVTSWLYCLYFEAGRVSIRFLLRAGQADGLIDHQAAQKHLEDVRCLRTELHHNLGFEASDQTTRSSAETWRRRASGTAVPDSDGDWRRCYDAVVAEAISFLGGLEAVVRRMEGEGDRAVDRLLDWTRRLDRDWGAAELDPVIRDAAYRLGRNGLNVVAFRMRHLERWRSTFEQLEDGFDLEREAAALVEKALLDDAGSVLPISGVDVMSEFGLAPGPDVGKALAEARKLFQARPMGREELLGELARAAGLSRRAMVIDGLAQLPPE